MKQDAIVNVSVFGAGVLAIAVGVAAYDWAAALVVVGVILVGTVVFARLLSLRGVAPKPPRPEVENESA